MREEVICDGCQTAVSSGAGYLFYSTARLAVAVSTESCVGLLLYCDSCADDRLAVRAATQTEIDSHGPIAGDANAIVRGVAGRLRDANAASIASACRRHRMTPAQAKSRAQELAARWWQDEETGALAAADFWTSDPFAVQTIEGWSDTIDNAFTQAERLIPKEADVLSRAVHEEPGTKTVIVNAFDEDQARSAVLSRAVVPEAVTVSKISLLKEGRRPGFFRSGVPNEYEVTVSQLAVVKVRYQRRS